jgi:hypothetical protein
MVASSGETMAPALTGVDSLAMTTLPASILAEMPTFWSSPTMGPGPNGVPPLGMTMSCGATWPPLRGAMEAPAFRLLKSLNGLFLVARMTDWPCSLSARASRPGRLLAACSMAMASRRFLEPTTATWPRRLARICCIWGAGMPDTSAMATTGLSVRILARRSTSAFFQGATWAWPRVEPFVI